MYHIHPSNPEVGCGGEEVPVIRVDGVKAVFSSACEMEGIRCAQEHRVRRFQKRTSHPGHHPVCQIEEDDVRSRSSEIDSVESRGESSLPLSAKALYSGRSSAALQYGTFSLWVEVWISSSRDNALIINSCKWIPCSMAIILAFL